MGGEGGGSGGLLRLSKRCFQWPRTDADVCFTTYHTSGSPSGAGADGAGGDASGEVAPAAAAAALLATRGAFSPADFEGLLHAAHGYW